MDLDLDLDVDLDFVLHANQSSRSREFVSGRMAQV